MRTRRILLRLIWGAAALVAIVGLVMVLTREPEPEYGGKRLSGWLEVYDGASSRPAAADAIRHIGTNGLPCLLKWIRYETPSWKAKCYAAANWPFAGGESREIFQDSKARRADAAAWVFRLLRPEAEACNPELSELLIGQPDTEGARRAALVLHRFGSAGLPPLIKFLTSRQGEPALRSSVFHYVVQAIAEAKTNAQPAIPGLQALLTDPDPSTRSFASNALSEIDPKGRLRTHP